MPENNFKTSFIPKKPVQPASKGGALRGNKGSNFLTTITLVIFFGTLIVGIGVYVYQLGLQKSITSQEQRLAEAQRSFDPEFINEATLLNNRIESVQSLLANHKSPSQIFELLEETTLISLQFTSLDYSTDDEGVISIVAKGLAKDFEAVVLQSDNYGQTGYLRDILFSGLQNTATGVSFDLEGTVDPNFVLYRNSLSNKNITEILDDKNNTDSGAGSNNSQESVVEDGGFPSE